MVEIRLIDYSNTITDPSIAETILRDIRDALGKQDSISVVFTGVDIMTTSCAKQIFGQLYLELGPEVFYQRMQLKDVDEDLRIIIKNAIQSAIT